jgi:ribosomal protein L9
MSSQLEKALEETFADISNLSQEKMGELLKEALKTFKSLQQMTHSSDPAEREEALRIASSIKQSLNAQIETISKQAGVDPALFASYSEQATAAAKEWLDLSAAKEQIEALQNRPTPKLPHKLNKAAWIPG